MTIRPTVVLFDIDGTLVHTLGAGVRGMNAAFADLYGRTDVLEGLRIAGRTDRAIVSDVFRRLDLDPTTDRVAALRDAYLPHLARELAQAPAGCSVLPGVVEAIDALERRGDVVVGLLTGNFHGGAGVKLRHFGLWDRFAFGAFGDEHLDRRDLVPVALAAARAAGHDVSPADLVVIGDTPLDVDCARAHGARAVAVATGPYTREALAREGADLTVETLADLDARGEWLTALVARPRRGTNR
jgi:phosphoglycolate phosphatase-like HAD superfamily hydrolase